MSTIEVQCNEAWRALDRLEQEVAYWKSEAARMKKKKTAVERELGRLRVEYHEKKLLP